jgi:hypothetical protein
MDTGIRCDIPTYNMYYILVYICVYVCVYICTHTYASMFFITEDFKHTQEQACV